MSDGAPPPYPPPGAPVPDEPVAPAPSFPPPGGHPGPPPPPHAPPSTYPPAAPTAPTAPTGQWAAYAASTGAGGVPAPGVMLGAAHKPGAMPLRPMNLGNIYDAAFRIIRFNPKATVGAAVMVTAAAMLIPVLITAVLTFTVGLAVDATGEIDADASTGDLIGLLAAYGSLLLSLVLAQVGTILVTGMIAHVTRAAAVGRRLDLGQAWAATRGRRWRLIGLTFVINGAFLLLLTLYVLAWVPVVVLSDGPWPVVVWGLVTVPAFCCLSAWLWIRFYYLPVPPLMLEGIGVFAAIGRGWRLTSRQYWRTFGIAVLTAIIGSFAGGMLSTPISLAGQFGAFAVPEYALLLLVTTQALALVVQNAFIAPFIATVTSVQYVDLRIRKEAFDVELMREAGIIPR